MILNCVVSRCLVLSLCFITSMAQTEGFIEHPSSMSVDRGEQATLSCTYRTAQQGLPNIMWTTPSGISVMPTTNQIDEDTLQSTISFIAATSSYAGDYQCTASVGSDSFNSDPATFTVNYYGIEFQDRLYTTLEDFDIFTVFLEVTQFGSQSRDATISITRDDNGPAINDTVVSMGGIIDVGGFIPNDEIRLGDRQITLTLTTSDDLIEIGSQSTTIIDVTEDDLDPPASIAPAVLRVTTESEPTFMATEYNADPLLYTWFFNGDFIRANNPKYSGQFTRNLTILNAQESDAGNYSCEFSVGQGASGQAIGQFFVFAPVTITSHPVNMTVNGTEEATFSVEATGGGLTYQWRRNGDSLSEVAGKLEGVNSPMLMVLDAQVGDEGFYSCVVTNGAGDSETSNEAFLFTVGLIEIPMNTTVEVGQEAIFTCTYRVPEPQPNNNIIISINFFNLPRVDTSIHVRTTDQFTWMGTLSFHTTSASPTVTSGYQCVVSINRVTLATTEPVTLTVSSYAVEFGLQEFRISEAADSFALPVITTARGSPSRNAIISFTRTDNGPTINNLTVNMTGTQEVEVQIPNDVIRTGDRVFNVTITTTETLVVIGEQRTVTVRVAEDDPAVTQPGSDALSQRASIAVLLFSVITAFHQFVSMYI